MEQLNRSIEKFQFIFYFVLTNGSLDFTKTSCARQNSAFVFRLVSHLVSTTIKNSIILSLLFLLFYGSVGPIFRSLRLSVFLRSLNVTCIERCSYKWTTVSEFSKVPYKVKEGKQSDTSLIHAQISLNNVTPYSNCWSATVLTGGP